jgi:hypothetical protein
MPTSATVALLAIIWLAWAGLLFGGLLLGHTQAYGRRMPTWSRIGSSLALVLAAWVGYVALSGSAARGLALLLAFGMTLGLLGDFFLAGLIPLDEPTLAGTSAFALGHVAYCAAFLSLGSRLAHPVGLRLAAWGAWLVLGLAGWYAIAYLGARAERRKPGLLHWAALPYSLLLASTAGLASGLALVRAPFILTGLGGALFLASDLLIASRIFRRAERPWLDDAVWLTYGPAQMLIVYSAWLAARALGA